MKSLPQDLRFALRTLAKSPVFTTVAIASLALGIGVNTAIFTYLDHLLLRTLPVRDPESIVLLDSKGPRSGRMSNQQAFSYPGYRDIRDNNDVFEGVIARFETPVSVTWKNQTEIATAEIVSGNYFDVLGLQPYAGRLITPEDDRTPGGHPVVVLGHGYWKRRFGGDTAVVNQKVLINGNPMEVIGIGPAGFRGVLVGDSMEVFVPTMMKAQVTPTWDDLENRRSWWLNVFARLKPGVTREQAQTRLAPVYRQFMEHEIAQVPGGSKRFRELYVQRKLEVLPGAKGRSWIRASMEKPFLVLMCMVGLVLLIACANLANLLIARAAARQKEIAIRLALGASRWHLVRQLVTESAVLSFAGGALGVLVAVWATDLMAGFGLAGGSGRTLDWGTPDARTLSFTLAVSALTALLFGLIPAWKATRPAVAGTLKDQAGSVASTLGDVRLRKGLVVAQIAFSLLLLFGAGLFARSLYNLRTLDPGFETDHVLSFTVDPSLNGYKPARSHAFFDQAQKALAAIPGVRLVAFADNPVLTNNVSMSTINIEGYTPAEGEDMNPDLNFIGAGYFSTLGIRLLAGRDLTENDFRPNAQRVVLINDAIAKKYFKGQSPVGRRLGFRRDQPDTVIVGVVENVRGTTMRDENRRFVYVPYTMNPFPTSMTYYVRTAGPPPQMAASVRAVMQRLDATLPLIDLRSMSVTVDQILAIDRAVAAMSAFFGLLATALAAIGLYGVMAYTVARRTREIGIRVALGAERSAVLWLVLKEVAVMAGLGILIGLPASIGLSRFITTQLYGLQAFDALTLTVATGTMALVSFLAGYMPANRAAKVDPIRALRYE